MAVEVELDAELLPFGRAMERARRLEAAGAELVDPYPEVLPTAVEDKLLYLSSSIYGRVIPAPLFYFEHEGRTYMLSPKLHYAAAQLLGDDAKALLIRARNPVYPFTAISMVLYDLGLKRQNKDYIEKYVCPEVRDIADGHIPLADKIRRVLNRYLAVKPAAGAVEALKCLCGPCDEDLAVEVKSLIKAKPKEVKSLIKAKPKAERAVSNRFAELFELLDEVEKTLVARIIKGFTIPGFKGELEELLKRYGI